MYLTKAAFQKKSLQYYIENKSLSQFLVGGVPYVLSTFLTCLSVTHNATTMHDAVGAKTIMDLASLALIYAENPFPLL